MSSSHDLAAQLLTLPAEERAYLAALLLESLDGDMLLEQTWKDEVLRRAEALEAATVQSLDGRAVLQAIRARLM